MCVNGYLMSPYQTPTGVTIARMFDNVLKKVLKLKFEECLKSPKCDQQDEIRS